MISARQDGVRRFGAACAAALRPPSPMTPSTWAERNLVVPDGPSAGRLFSLALAPYLREPLDFLGPDAPVNEIAIMKSAQTGFTLALIAALGAMIDRSPCRALVI